MGLRDPIGAPASRISSRRLGPGTSAVSTSVVKPACFALPEGHASLHDHLAHKAETSHARH